MTQDRINPFKQISDEDSPIALPDLADFKPKSKPLPSLTKNDIDELAEKTGFPSRQQRTEQEQAKNEVRRYRTGRNQQLNIKVTQESLQKFYALADQLGVTLGETFEKAVALLDESINLKK